MKDKNLKPTGEPNVVVKDRALSSTRRADQALTRCGISIEHAPPAHLAYKGDDERLARSIENKRSCLAQQTSWPPKKRST